MRGESHLPLSAKVCQNGVAPVEAMVFHARPIKPETGLLRSPSETWSQMPKTWLVTEKPAIWMVSSPKIPAASPLPYWILNSLDWFWNVDDVDESKVATESQPVIQFELANQRSLMGVFRLRGKEDMVEGDLRWPSVENDIVREGWCPNSYWSEVTRRFQF